MDVSTHLRHHRRVRALVLGLAVAAGACGGHASTAAAGAIDREAFIATYVDLRAATIRSDSFAISDALRAEVLTRHGVAEEDLLGFVEVHGEDAAFMRAVWDEVEARLDAERVLPASDEVNAPGAAPDSAADPAPTQRPRPR